MESQLMRNPIVLRLALQYHAIKKTLSNYVKNIGKPPVIKDDLGLYDDEMPDKDELVLKLALYSVEGDDTDEAVLALAVYAVYIIAAVALIAGGITIFFYASIILDFASLCLLGMAPVVAYQKFKLQNLGNFRDQHIALRNKVNLLVMENNKLTSTINELEVQMGRLSQVEEGLSKIANKSGTQVHQLVDLVKENGQLQLEIKKTLEKQVESQLIDMVVHSDRDGNFVLTPSETEMLKVRFKSMEGVKFNPSNFDKMIASDENELTLTDMMNIIRNLLDDEVPEEENIFVLDPESVTARKDGLQS